jgi:DASS family divalent anion:Na+ symporter
MAYYFIRIFGKGPLGLAYGLNIADLLLAPAIPSNTARAAVLYILS